MDGSPSNEVTRLLREWRHGDSEALNRLLPHVYDDLKRQARRCLQGERPGHTLQTTALVHEAYARLVHAEIPWKDRVHFFSVAARAMRRILVDHARAKGAAKRGQGAVPVTLEETAVVSATPMAELLELDRALEKLSSFDERKGRMVELFFFAGLTYEELARALDTSTATVHRDLRVARAWLRREMEAGDSCSR